MERVEWDVRQSCFPCCKQHRYDIGRAVHYDSHTAANVGSSGKQVCNLVGSLVKLLISECHIALTYG